MLLCLVMVIKSLKVEHVFIQFIFSILDPLFLSIDFTITSLLEFLVFVALVVPTSLLSMFLPIP
jgi:hypothetical protein